MNVEIGAEAALFPEKEYINGIAVALWYDAVKGFKTIFVFFVENSPRQAQGYVLRRLPNFF